MSVLVTEPTVALADEAEQVLTPAAVTAPAPAVAPAPAAPVAASQRSWVDAAVEVLPADGSTLSVSEILAAISERGLRDYSQAKTPYQTLARDLRVASRKTNARVRQTAPGRFARA